MLTINENAPVKSSNLKTILAALSSVAVIGAATTYIASAQNESKRTSELSKFMSDDMHGDFDFEFNGSGYITNGRFSKTIDQNGEWEVEYILEGEDSSFALKDGAYMRKYQNESKYTCQQNIDNIGYGKYKYDLLQAVKVDRSQLTNDSQEQIKKSCNLEDDLYVLENEDFGNLIVCPSNNVNGLRAGIIAEGFSGIVKSNEGLRELRLSEDFEFDNQGIPCREHSKFKSVVDTLNESITEEDKKLNIMTTTAETSSTFPFSDRKLEMRAHDGSSGGLGASTQRSWVIGSENGPGSRPAFGSGGSNGSRRSSLDCHVIHGAGNNKGYYQTDAGSGGGATGRFEYTKWANHGNQTGGYNSKSFQPCWVYKTALGAPVVKFDKALGVKNSGPFTAKFVKKHKEYNYTLDNPSYVQNLNPNLNSVKYTGYNLYWGDNLLKNRINGMSKSTNLLADSCNWTTFGDFNSNQLSYKTPLIMAQISHQICGYASWANGNFNSNVGTTGAGCVFGTQWGFKQLVLAHSMGTMLVMQVIQYGLIKKGPRGTIALAGAPLRGSIGASGVEHYCSTTTIGAGYGAAALNKLNWWSHFWSPLNVGYALSQGSSCGSNKIYGGIEVIKQLVLMYVSGNTHNTQSYMGPLYFSVNKTGSYPDSETDGLVDKKLCGLNPIGGVSAKTMERLTNTSCQDANFCLEMKCSINLRRCHFRGCTMHGLLSACDSTKKSSYTQLKWVYQHDNHVSKHSCMSDHVHAGYFGYNTVQSGTTITLTQSNHKHMCCKYGNGAGVHVKPCMWYKDVATLANSKN